MKIGLVDPRTTPLAEESFPQLGIGYLAAAVTQDVSLLRVLDRRTASREEEEAFLAERFDAVGISAASFTFRDALAFGRAVKARRPQTRVVLGGPHVSVTLADSLAEGVGDLAVYGEGEATFADLVRRWRTSGTQDRPASVPGLIYPEEDRFVRTPPRPPLADLDAIPFPAFHLFPMQAYSSYPLMTSRGCPFRCVYCCCHLLWGKKPRFRSAENILSEIRYARERFHWKGKPFLVLDDTFNLQPGRVEAFCEGLLREHLDITYHVWGFRADLAPMEMIRKLKASGCLSVSMGIESADPDVLRRIRKGESLAQIVETLRNLRKAGIHAMCLFMIGNPGDTLQSTRETLRFAKKERIYLMAFNMALPYPGTELWDFVQSSGRFLHKDFTRFHHYSTEPVFETDDFTAEERTRAFLMARRFERTQRIKFEVLRKVDALRRGEFRTLSWDKVYRAARRLGRYVIDLTLDRNRTEKL